MTLRWHLNMSLMDHVRNIITVVIPFYIHSSPLAVFKRFSVFFYNHHCPTPYTTRGHSGMSLSAPQKDWMINWPWKDSEQWNRITTGDGASKRAQTPWKEREGCRSFTIVDRKKHIAHPTWGYMYRRKGNHHYRYIITVSCCWAYTHVRWFIFYLRI